MEQFLSGLLGLLNASTQSFTSGFPVFIVHVSVAGVILLVAAISYVILTPHRELELLRSGNASAGLALGGVILGLAIPLAACLANSVGLYDLVFWAVPTVLLQLLAFRIVDMFLRDLPKRIRNDEAGAAILLVAVKIATGLLIAAAFSSGPGS